MNWKGKWIRPKENLGDVCPVFKRNWQQDKKVEKVELYITALGVYNAYLNQKRISNYVLAPGWTAYDQRLQYQVYDITDLIKTDNQLEIVVGKGWYRSPMNGIQTSLKAQKRVQEPAGLYVEIHFSYENGENQLIVSDSDWLCGESKVRFSEIYDGESYDASFSNKKWKAVETFDGPFYTLIPQEGEIIREQEIITAKEIICTPKGERVIDFGQEITGYVQFTVKAHKGDRIRIQHGEMLDAEGNFYRENYRGAKSEINYICCEDEQTWHPLLTFFGFRYIKLTEFPGEIQLDQFKAIAVYSDMKRTGYLSSSDDDLNQLFSNIFWGQRCNFLDVPTDCPQRDERLGWTGDAQVFVKAASYNFNVEKFFTKWLRDLAAEQTEDGAVYHVVPDWFEDHEVSTAWGDAAVICPWQIYMTYGDKNILKEFFECMQKWVDYITSVTTQRYLWTGGSHYGDWLGLDAPSGSYKGSSRDDLIASAFYGYSTELVIKAGKALGKNMSVYENLHDHIREIFQEVYPEYKTQTEYVLSIWFGLSADPQTDTDQLAKMIIDHGGHLEIGFVGTPYLLHALSKYGHTELAYSLLLNHDYPSWLYSVKKGATTIWEHWDGVMEDGSFWSTDMNSFNHYAYGAVADWVYEVAAGITPVEEYPGFERVRIQPMPSRRLGWLEAAINTKYGIIKSKWIRLNSGFRYEIETAVPAEIHIGNHMTEVVPGKYIFYENAIQ